MKTNDVVILGTCALCGQVIEPGSDYVRHNGAYICGDCEETGYFECCDCGELHYMGDNAGDYDGDPLCNDCYENNGYWTCEDCDEIFSDSDDCITINGRYERYVCESCVDRNYYKCDDCGEYFNHDNIWVNSNMTICYNCSDNYAVCDDCGDVFHVDNGTYSDRDDHWYCDYCYSNHNHSDLIWDYSEKPDPVFHNTPDDFRGDGYRLDIGVENEISGYNAHINAAAEEIRDIADEDHVYMKSDCSISNGFEIVSHPCTLAYHANNFPWADIFRAARQNQFDIEHSSCGLHCHVNRRFFGADKQEQDLHVAKLILVVEKLWDDITMFARRGGNQYNSKPGVKYERGDNEYTLHEKYHRMGFDRYYAINVTNNNTVEFRMFRNTLHYSTFIATLQFVDTICRYVKAMNIADIATVTMGDIIASAPETFTELREYCELRGVEIHAAPAAAATADDDISAAIVDDVTPATASTDIEIPEYIRNMHYCSYQYREAQRRLLGMTSEELRAFTRQFTIPNGGIAWDLVIFRLVGIVEQEFSALRQQTACAAAV